MIIKVMFSTVDFGDTRETSYRGPNNIFSIKRDKTVIYYHTHKFIKGLRRDICGGSPQRTNMIDCVENKTAAMMVKRYPYWI